MAAIRGDSQQRLSCAALVILMTGHVGSEMRIHVCPVGLEMRGRSVLQWIGLLPHSMIRELIGKQNPVTSLVITALESRQWRKAGHIRGAIEKLALGTEVPSMA